MWFAFGLIVSIVYFCLFFYIRPWSEIFDFIRSDDLNSVGDFLAGALGPVSIFWVVVGYLQNQKQLGIQAKELSNAVEMARENLRVTSQKMQPDVRLTEFSGEYVGQGEFKDGGRCKHLDYKITLYNLGEHSAKSRLIFFLTGGGSFELDLGAIESGLFPKSKICLMDGARKDKYTDEVIFGFLLAPPDSLAIEVHSMGRQGVVAISRYLAEKSRIDDSSVIYRLTQNSSI